MKILSLFDGMSCGMIAMQNAGIAVDRYVAYEIDKYAIQTSKHNFPMIEQSGDVFKADFSEYEGFDYLIGGSPCTYWSIAQTKNRETIASGMGWDLFCQYVRALKDVKPKYFLYENNKSMSAAIRQSITETFGFEPICINSALVSAQNRQRLYWVGIRNEDGSYRKASVKQPEDRGILLKDILETSFALSDKSHAVIYSAGRTTEREYFKKSQGDMVAEPVKPLSENEIDYMVRDHQEQRWSFLNKPGEEDKSKCVVANISKGVPYNVLAEPVSSVQVGALPRPNGELSTSQAFRVYSADGKSVTLKGCGGGAGGKTGLYAIPECGTTKYPIYEVKDGMITIKGKKYPIKLVDGYYIIRKLTVRECMRLQTVPEWYEFPVSNSQAYKMLGNGWTCEVITHLLKGTL